MLDSPGAILDGHGGGSFLVVAPVLHMGLNETYMVALAFWLCPFLKRPLIKQLCLSPELR